ncbi:MAG: SET domain-containing protein [Pseudomonadota bacterium]
MEKIIKLNPDLRAEKDPQLGEFVPIKTQVFNKLNIKKSVFSKDVGLGVFADEDIVQDSVIMIGGGQLASTEDKFPKEKDYAGIFNEKYFMAPIDFDSPTPNWLMNHSCEPNIKIIGGLIVVALRDIKKGEELTVDYATVIAGDYEWQMKCECGLKECRKIITNNDWRDKKLFKKYYQMWAPFIQKRGQLLSS